MKRTALGVLLAALLVSCGGGGGGNSAPPPPSGPTFAPESTLAARCASPRSGTDPYTGMPYPDKQGSLLDEQNWLASWTNDLYLWFDQVSFGIPANYATAIDYFNVLKTNALANGKPVDRFHFTYPTGVWEALSQSGVQPGYGAVWSIVSGAPPRVVEVAYTEPNSPATNLSPPLARGATVLAVDGVDINVNTQAGVNSLNAGLFPANADETHTFLVQDLGATQRTITLVSANVVSTPVQNVGVISGTSVGYMLFNDHLATAEPALINAVTTLQATHITDLVIDIRYNGGGYLAIASELAYMIAGPGVTSGQTFELNQFNSKHPTVDPVTGMTINPLPFLSVSQGFTASPAAGTPLPHLDLTRVVVLTGPGTCSASESIINGLRGIGVPVIQVGSATCGKPYAFYPTDNCGTTYFSIQIRGVNAVGFGAYDEGFSPENALVSNAALAILPGCSVYDDFSHALGDPNEARLAAALTYLASSLTSCPTPSGLGAPGGVRRFWASDGRVVKSPFASNRILRH